MKILATVYIGSYEVMTSIYELKRGKDPKRINEMRLPVPLVHDIANTGRVSMETTERLVSAISDMKVTMKGLKVDSVELYAGATLHHARNVLFVLSQIETRTGLRVHAVRNSEQRFFEYEAVTALPGFSDWTGENAILADIGGASLQLTLFHKGAVETTQHLSLGTFHLREGYRKLAKYPDAFEQMSVMIDKEFDTFQNMYLQRKVETVIIFEDQRLAPIEMMRDDRGQIDCPVDSLLSRLEKSLSGKDGASDILFDETFEDTMEEAVLLLHRELLRMIPAKRVIIPPVTINDGIASHFAREHKLLASPHDFRTDILSAARAISKRCRSYQPHLEALLTYATEIFDAMKKVHGMGERERVMLETACILHDCGKYISISRASECSLEIILCSEILGLTHKEREMIASVVEYNREDLPPYQDLKEHYTEGEYWTITKLVAILRVANALDRSHKQKFKDVSIRLKKKDLIIGVHASDSITLEKGMFGEIADFFFNVFAIRPGIRELKL